MPKKTKSSSPRKRQVKAPAALPHGHSSFPIVGIGASAGGLEAFEALLARLPADTGMGFVLVQHMSPDHESLLPQLLARNTTMPVHQAVDGDKIVPNHIYIIPPKHNLGILHGALQLLEYEMSPRRYLPVDFFFSSLAEDIGSHAIGVVLSGTASDGTLGLKSIKAAGGITLAQDEESAEYSGMPASAVAAGCVDYVLTPAAIVEELVRIARHPYLLHDRPTGGEIANSSPELLNKVFLLLRSHTGNDFTYYKHTTIKRRIKRRMLLHKLDRFTDYVGYLQRTPDEVQALFEDILINVTSFFRDPETFDALSRELLPKLLENRTDNQPIRIWIPGCASGEEVYSVAMALIEVMEGEKINVPVQLFASDIDEAAVDQARRGIYPAAISEQLTPQRLRRFFNKHNSGYQVSKTIRDLCVFAVQSITKDPPFSRLDLICCRNVLIYLGPVLQKKVLQVFHYALNPGGYLMLGVSESIGAHADLYSLVDKKNRIYRKKSLASPIAYDFTSQPMLPNAMVLQQGDEPAGGAARADPSKVAEQLILKTYGPPGVLVSAEMDILQFFGDTSAYISPTPGLASLNLMKMARQEMIVMLRAGARKALTDKQPVRQEHVRIKRGEVERLINIQLLPLLETNRGVPCLLVLFEEVGEAPDLVATRRPIDGAPEGAGDGELVDIQASRIRELEQELSSTREYMQSVIEDQEATNEEMKSASEEIQSTNEELQSTNEELETAKEEMQSGNEELATVNEELENRNMELTEINSDLINLMDSIELAILMLDSQLSIRQFTPEAARLFNIIDGDVGRPIGQIKSNMEWPDLEERAYQVMESITPYSRELQDNDGHWYSLRMRPYKAIDRRIAGVVITCVEIDSIKDAERLRSALEQERRLSAVVRDANDAITVQDFTGRILAWNPAAERIYGYSEAEALAMGVEVLVAKDDLVGLREMQEKGRLGKGVPAMHVTRLAKGGGLLNIALTTTALLDEKGRPALLATTEQLL